MASIPYPLPAIVAGTAIMLVVATLLAALLARLGFPIQPMSATVRRRFTSIDGLRGYLALFVLAHHAVIWLQVIRLGTGWSEPTVNILNQSGAASVALFFMITGLLFYPVVGRGLQGTNWAVLIVRRVWRLMPPIATSVLLITVLISVRTGAPFERSYPLASAKWIVAWSQPPLLGYPDSARLNAYVLWSLSYEWLFYLVVLPVCAGVRQLLPQTIPTVAIPIGVILVSIVMQRTGSTMAFWRYLPLFAVGMLTADLIDRKLTRSLNGPLQAAAAILLGGLRAFVLQSLRHGLAAFRDALCRGG